MGGLQPNALEVIIEGEGGEGREGLFENVKEG